ncbi:MAG: ABC transporter substrate-binding protein [Anaerolineae bacterium]|nr:ABC transporter substrate-binding protein [Anaerolineae bacterium]
MKFWMKWVFLFVVLLGLVGCGAEAAQAPTQAVEAPAQEAPAAAATEAPADELRKVRLGVGYIPDVQFAPFYVAQSKGFYAEEGLEVEIEYGFENDFVALAAQGEREFAVASGDQVILARAQGLPITYVMKWYQRFPVALVSPADKGITQPSDLVGKKVGLPGFFGASFIGWKGLIYAAQLDENTIEVKDIGFTQTAAIQQGVVDAAMIYIANEPNQLRSQGIEVKVLQVSDYLDLVSNGIVVGDKLMADDPDLVQRMVRASLRGLQETIAKPDDAFAIVRQVIPEITDDKAPTQRKVLEDSIMLWQSDKLGESNPQAWQESVEFMSKTGLLEKTLAPEMLYTNKFIEVE